MLYRQSPSSPSPRTGAAALEFAIVAPLFFLLVMGLFEFGRMMMVQEILTNGVREGARKAVLPGATQSDVNTVIDNYMTSAGISGHTKSCTPDPATATGGSTVTVTVSVPYNSVSWLPVSTVRFLNNKTLTATVVMRKEEY